MGWGGAALVTPIVMGGAGALFFAGSILAPGAVEPGTIAAVMLALGPAAGIATQVRRAAQGSGRRGC